MSLDRKNMNPRRLQLGMGVYNGGLSSFRCDRIMVWIDEDSNLGWNIYTRKEIKYSQHRYFLLLKDSYLRYCFVFFAFFYLLLFSFLYVYLLINLRFFINKICVRPVCGLFEIEAKIIDQNKKGKIIQDYIVN